LRFVAKPEFDVQEMWAVGVVIRAADGVVHSFATQVEATPPGLGPWDLLIYLFPFVLFGALWAVVFMRRARKRTTHAARNLPAPTEAKSDLCCQADYNPHS
jgi:cytochrome c-type biogenesis protein CcmH/NrfF